MLTRGVAQLAARHVRDVEVGSSSLLTPTFFQQMGVTHKVAPTYFTNTYNTGRGADNSAPLLMPWFRGGLPRKHGIVLHRIIDFLTHGGYDLRAFRIGQNGIDHFHNLSHKLLLGTTGSNGRCAETDT